MITMEQFVSILEEMLKKKSKTMAFLMVGERCVDMRRDASRSVHFFLLDNDPWYVHTLEFAVFVRKLTGKSLVVNLSSTSVLAVKERIYELEGVPVDQQRVIHGGRQLEENHTLNEYDIPTGGLLHVILRMRGGGCLPGVPFVDVTDGAGPTKIKWSETAPAWRIARKGLCLEGKCTNSRCKAYGHMVIMNKGFNDFDLINEAHTCHCPICDEGVVPITCAFNNCHRKIIGRKVDKLGNPPEMFRSDWKYTGDNYERFSPSEHGTAHFLDLKILCKEARPLKCAVCTTDVVECNRKKARCGHTFHEKDCFTLATSDDRSCIECMARENMTCHQKLFA